MGSATPGDPIWDPPFGTPFGDHLLAVLAEMAKIAHHDDLLLGTLNPPFGGTPFEPLFRPPEGPKHPP